MAVNELFLAKATALLGSNGWTRDADLMAPWQTDWRGRYHGQALALASPASTAEVAALVRLCAEHQVPIVPQGGNSGMSGGATPDKSGTALLLSLRRMNAIRSFDRENRQCVCDAGVVLSDLHSAAADHDLRFPLTLGGKGSATIGGLISTNAGGTQVLRHGTMRANVLGLEVVLPDGEIWTALSPLKKDNRGFDLKQIYIGSEGTLGIVTAATLALAPAITARRVAWIGLPDLATARRLLLFCTDKLGAALEGFEVLPRSCLNAVLAYLPGARDPLAGAHQWYVLMEVVTETAGEEHLHDRVTATLADASTNGLLSDATIAASEAQAEALWALRDAISPAERAKGPASQHDISIPVAAVPDFVTGAVSALEHGFPGCRAFGFGHLGDGNIHFHVTAPAGMAAATWESGPGKEASKLVHDLVTAWGGSISAEHGIGQMKLDELLRLGDPVFLRTMHQIKQALDPANLLNPGKLVRVAP